MRRHLLTLALAGVFGILAAADASACCHKRAKCPTPCAVVEPCPPPAPVCEPCPPPAPKCGLFKHLGGCGHHRMKLNLCHKRPACEPAPIPCEAPVVYAPAPSPQVMPSGQ